MRLSPRVFPSEEENAEEDGARLIDDRPGDHLTKAPTAYSSPPMPVQLIQRPPIVHDFSRITPACIITANIAHDDGRGTGGFRVGRSRAPSPRRRHRPPPSGGCARLSVFAVASYQDLLAAHARPLTSNYSNQNALVLNAV